MYGVTRHMMCGGMEKKVNKLTEPIGGKLNELCYLEDTSAASDAFFYPCGADLICMVFKPRCGTRQGECVSYCNAFDRFCPEGLSCCYGIDDNGKMKCVELKTGELKWENDSVGKGSISYADGLFVVRGEGGPIALVEASPKAYVQKGRFNQVTESEPGPS